MGQSKVTHKVTNHMIAGYKFYDIQSFVGDFQLSFGKGQFTPNDLVGIPYTGKDGVKYHIMTQEDFLKFLSLNNMSVGGLDGASFKDVRKALKRQAIRFLPNAKAVGKLIATKPQSIADAVKQKRIEENPQRIEIRICSEFSGSKAFKGGTKFTADVQYTISDSKDLGVVLLLKEKGYIVTTAGYAIDRRALLKKITQFLSDHGVEKRSDQAKIRSAILSEIDANKI